MIRLILVVLAVVLYLIFSIPVLSYLKNLERKVLTWCGGFWGS